MKRRLARILVTTGAAVLLLAVGSAPALAATIQFTGTASAVGGSNAFFTDPISPVEAFATYDETLTDRYFDNGTLLFYEMDGSFDSIDSSTFTTTIGAESFVGVEANGDFLPGVEVLVFDLFSFEANGLNTPLGFAQFLLYNADGSLSFEAGFDDVNGITTFSVFDETTFAEVAFGQFDAAVFVQDVVIPEPGTLVLLGSGLLGFAGYGRRRGRT